MIKENSNVIVYSTSWCGPCKNAKRLLNDRGIDFQEIDIEERGLSRDDLYDITGESDWLVAGLDLAEDVCDVYFQNQLPLGASSTGWYESQLGPAFLIHGLTRLALLAQDNCTLAPNYTAR